MANSIALTNILGWTSRLSILFQVRKETDIHRLGSNGTPLDTFAGRRRDQSCSHEPRRTPWGRRGSGEVLFVIILLGPSP